jgi:hypothetical protein
LAPLQRIERLPAKWRPIRVKKTRQIKNLEPFQFTLLAISAVWTAWLWRFDRGRARQVALQLAVNLAVNLIFFMTHPIFTPYYIIPIDMLSL